MMLTVKQSISNFFCPGEFLRLIISVYSLLSHCGVIHMECFDGFVCFFREKNPNQKTTHKVFVVVFYFSDLSLDSFLKSVFILFSTSV